MKWVRIPENIYKKRKTQTAKLANISGVFIKHQLLIYVATMSLVLTQSLL